ncbi:NADH:ubiquinone reductase (Na(+)-transporting) subunit F [Gordonia sp. NPDC062954]|jgi:phenol hydroxylase P5 protein|uniref:NADH:ubiquinone reductase (Na(+)-transporting) subunit F n=1 Tax=Gordonia TaxID=2053 RepID=UPI0026A1E003
MTITMPAGPPHREATMSTHRVEIKGSADAFDVADGQPILDAALRAGAWIPHSCTQGTCGTCKLKVLCGSVDHRESPEYTLTGAERADDLALACMATPQSDLVVEPTGAVDDGVPHHPLRDYLGEVVELSDVAANTRRLVVDLDEDMAFNAGQYCELIVPGHGVGRQYSMANPPGEQRRLEFHVKRTPGGLATDGWIFDSLAVGDRIDLRGPLGQFNLVHQQAEPAILIGGGTGLAPLKSIVRHALDRELVPEMYLYHGGRGRADLYDVEFFTDLAAQHEHFHYRPALSDESWDGATGLVTDVVVGDFRSCKGMSAYLCGPPAMIDAAVKSLKRRRMAPRLIFREEFTPAASVATP